MSQTVIDRLTEELNTELERMDTLAAADDFDPDSTEFTAGRARVDELKRSIDARRKFMDMRASAHELLAATGRPRGADDPPARDKMTPGEEFTRSDVFTNYPGRGTSSRFLIRALPMALATFPAIPHVVVDNNAPTPVTPLLGLIPSIPVSTNSVDLVTFVKVAGGAAVVAEGANKPSVEFGPTSTTVTLDTVAGYTQATRQLLEDSSAIRALIDQELRRDVLLKLESEAAAALVAATIPTGAGTTLLESIRVGIGAVQAQGYNPNAVLLNPADWATLDITVMGKTLLGPSLRSEFWGLTPVAATSQPAGTATVGDFSAGASRFTRNGVNLYITDSHASTFIQNVFTILAEARSKTVIRHPNAFYEATKTP